jgi:hypothetical protein
LYTQVCLAVATSVSESYVLYSSYKGYSCKEVIRATAVRKHKRFEFRLEITSATEN